MKKTLALLLALLMVTSCMVFTTAAEETDTTQDASYAIVPMSDCDSATGWSGVTLDNTVYTQGTGSLSTSFTGIKDNTAAVQLQWRDLNKPIDATGMNALCFDVYLENAQGLAHADFDFEIRDAIHPDAFDSNGDGTIDTEIEATGCFSLMSVADGPLVDGWNHIEIPFSRFGASINNIDLSQIVYFRMFSSNPGKVTAESGDISYGTPGRVIGTEGKTTVMKLDNMYFASEKATSVSEDSFILNRGNTFYKLSGGGTNDFTVSRFTACDVTAYDTLVFDVFMEHADLNDLKLWIEFTSSGTYDIEESGWADMIDTIAGELTVGWNRVELPLNKLGFNKFSFNGEKVVSGSCDFTNLDFFRFYVSQDNYSVAEGEPGHYIGIAGPHLITKNNDAIVPIWDGQDKTGVSATGNCGDIDGDGTNEWIWCDETGEVDHTNAASIVKGVTFSPRPGFGNMIGVEFDIYVSDATAVSMGNFVMEFTSSGTWDNAEIEVAGTLNTIFDAQVKAGEWQTVRVYIDNKIPTRQLPLEDYFNANKPYGEFNPAGFNYIRWWGGGFTTTDLKLAMRNFKILRDVDAAPTVTEEGCTAPITMDNGGMRIPSTTDAMNSVLRIVDTGASGTFNLHSGGYIKLDQPLDLSNKSVMHLDLYLQNYNPAVLYEFEMTSSGKEDAQERRFTQKTLAYITGRDDLKDGWNHVEIPLEAFSQEASCNMSAINFFRIFSQTATSAVDKRTIVAIDNMSFSGPSSEYVDEMNYSTPASGTSSTCVTIAKGEDTTNNAWVVMNYDGGATAPAVGTRHSRKTYTYAANADSVFAMDIYIENYQDAKSITYQFELTSSGKMDVEESSRSGSLEQLFGAYVLNEDGSKGSLADGWNHIEIPLSQFKGGCNYAAINYIGIYPNNDPVATGNAYRVAFDNIHFIVPETEVVAGPVTKIYSAQPTLKESIDFTIKAQDENAGPVAIECIFTGDGVGTIRTIGAATPNADGFYYTTFDGISAHRMTDTLTMKLWTLDENGKMVVAHTVDYSVQQYIVNMLGNTGDEALITLLSDLLAYGAAAQAYGNYNMDALATDIDETLLSKLTPSTFTKPSVLSDHIRTGNPADDEFDATFKSATLVLGGTVHIRYDFTANTVDGLTMNVGGVEYSSFVPVKDGEGNVVSYYVDVPVTAPNFDTTYTAYFGTNDAYNVIYSVNHYIAKMHNPELVKTAALLEALYCYGVSADAYVAQ